MDSPTAMNFTENQQANAILDKIRMQKEKGRFCDVIFHLKDQEYLAHRNVLAACSPYFDSMLKMNKVAKEHMTINCTDHKVFEMLLDYVYTGKIIIDLNIVAELLKLSNQFMIAKLKAYCSEYLERNLYTGNCFWTKELAERCGLQTLGKTAEAYMLANIIEVIEQNEVLEFPVGRMEAFLSNKSLPLVEELKVHLINRWTRRYLEERVSKYQLLLSFILWDKVNMYAVCTMLAEDPLFASSEWCMYSILQTLHDSVQVLPEGYADTLHHLKEKLMQRPPMESNQLMHLAVSTAIGELETHTPQPRNKEKVETDVTPCEKTLPSPMGGAVCNNNKLTCDVSETKTEKKENGSEDAMNGDFEAMDEDSDTDDYDAEDEAFARNLQIDQSAEDDDDDKTEAATAQRDDEVKDDKDEEDQKDSMPTQREKYDGRSKHKRKGIPVKVRIPKSKIKLEMRVPKKRGRPPRLSYKKPIKTEHTKLSEPPEANVENQYTNDAKRENMNCDEDDDIDDKDEQFEDENDHDYSPSDGDAPDGESKEKRRGRKKKLHEKFSCPKCFYVTMSSAKLDHHLEHAHRDDTTYACSVCTFKSMWNREYYLHMKEHFPGPPFECDNEDCDYSADRIQPLLYHRMVHTNERPYECTVCNMRFRTKNNLTTHLRCHTGEKPFKCIICERCFATKGTLEQHSVTHSDHRPYLCDTCGFNTKYQSHLIAHKRIHTGDVFHCQYTNCKYMTPKRSQLACHMRSHMSIRSHICSMCGRAFVEKSHLVRHERIHLDDKPFKCGECEYSSTRRDKLKEHTLKYHSPESTVKVPFKPRKPRRQSFSPNAFPGMSQEQAEAQMHQGHITIQPTSHDQGNVSRSVAPYSHYTLTNLTGASQYVQSGVSRTAAPPNYNYLLNTTCGSTGTTNMAIEPSIASYENSNISNTSSAVVSSPMTMMPHQIQPQHMLPSGRGCIDAISNVAAAAAAACVSVGGVTTVDNRGLGLMMDPHSLPTMVPHLLSSTMMTQHHHQRLNMDAQQRGMPPVGYTASQPSPHPSHPSTPQPPPPQQLSSPPPTQQPSAQQPPPPPQQQQQQPQQDFTGLHAFMGMYL